MSRTGSSRYPYCISVRLPKDVYEFLEGELDDDTELMSVLVRKILIKYAQENGLKRS